jgi:hypothetical protein
MSSRDEIEGGFLGPFVWPVGRAADFGRCFGTESEVVGTGTVVAGGGLATGGATGSGFGLGVDFTFGTAGERAGVTAGEDDALGLDGREDGTDLDR